jgi:hypothetical protein
MVIYRNLYFAVIDNNFGMMVVFFYNIKNLFGEINHLSVVFEIEKFVNKLVSLVKEE